MFKRAQFYPVVTFLVAFLISQSVAFITYQTDEKKKQQLVNQELKFVSNNIRQILEKNAASATKLAISYNADKAQLNFDSIATEILKENKYADVIQTTNSSGVINKVYPIAPNRLILGYNILKDPFRKYDAVEAIKRKHIFYGGPYSLMQDNQMAIIGRMPVFDDVDSFMGFSVVITKLSTLKRAFQRDTSSTTFEYQFDKIRPESGATIFQLFDGFDYHSKHIAYTDLEVGNWRLYVALTDEGAGWAKVVAICIIGFLLSVVAGWYAYHLLNEPIRLNNIIREKTKLLAESERYFRTLIETSSDGLILLGVSGEIIYAAQSASQITAYSKYELVGRNLLSFVGIEEQEIVLDFLTKVASTNESIVKVNFRVKKHSGELIYLKGSMRNLLQNQSVSAIVFSFRDVTHEVNTRQALLKSSREVELLNKVNDYILHISAEQELCEIICECIVKNGGYKLAWIAGKPDSNDEEQKLKKLFSYGETGYLNEIEISLTQPIHANGPAARVFNGEPYFVTNFLTSDPDFTPWIDSAKKYGFASVGVFPIQVHAAEVWGSLIVYSNATDAFDKHEITVLARIANNLSLALKAIQTKADKDRASYLLNERIKELRTIHEISSVLQHEELYAHQVLSKIAELLPSGMQFVDFCAARLSYKNEQYSMLNFENVVTKIECGFKTDDGERGTIEIGYTYDFSNTLQSIFSDEEHELIHTTAELLESHFNKKHQQHELEKSEANLRTIFDNTEVGYLLMDNNFVIKAFNTKFYNGYAAETGIVLNHEKLFTESLLDDRKEMFLEAARHVFSNLEPFAYQTSYQHKQQTSYYHVVVVPILIKGQVLGLCLSAVDITHIKKLELERQEYINVLLDRNRDLEQFAYIISHNLRAPLANIKGLVSLIGQASIDNETRFMIDALSISTERLDTIVKDLNTILDIKRNVATQEIFVVDINQIIEHLKVLIGNMIDDANVVFDIDLSQGSKVYGIDVYLDSIFLNLVTNSIKYAQPGIAPVIKIKSAMVGGFLKVTYQDKGMGIDLSKHGAQVFGFYKRFNTVKEGKGLGLFLIKSHIEALGGSIQVSSQVNVGTTFEMYFRLAN